MERSLLHLADELVGLDRATADGAAEDGQQRLPHAGTRMRILASKIQGSGGSSRAGKPATSLQSGTRPTSSEGQSSG